MVLQVAPDARQVRPDRQAEPLQLLLGGDAGQRQQPRGLHGARADDDLVLCVEALETTLADHLDAGAALAVEQEPDGARVGQDLQARVVGDRPEERPVGGLAAPVARRELRELDAVRRGAVGVVLTGNPAARPASTIARWIGLAS